MATETGEGTADADESVADESAVETGEDLDQDESPYGQFERSAIVTIGATLSGMAAAVASALYITDPESTTALLLVAAAIFLQFPIYRVIGMDTDDFGIKGNLYIAVMTFILWFLTWSIILTTGALEAL